MSDPIILGPLDAARLMDLDPPRDDLQQAIAIVQGELDARVELRHLSAVVWAYLDTGREIERLILSSPNTQAGNDALRRALVALHAGMR